MMVARLAALLVLSAWSERVSRSGSRCDSRSPPAGRRSSLRREARTPMHGAGEARDVPPDDVFALVDCNELPVP